MYQFVVDFIGEIPEQYEFIYTIVTLILSVCILGSFTSIFYFILRLIRGVV